MSIQSCTQALTAPRVCGIGDEREEELSRKLQLEIVDEGTDETIITCFGGVQYKGIRGMLG